jgi:hypothetical protein
MESLFDAGNTFKSGRYVFASKCGRGSALVADNHRNSELCFLKSTLARDLTNREVEICIVEADRLKRLTKLDDKENRNKFILQLTDHFAENGKFFTISPYLEVTRIFKTNHKL